MQSTGVGRRHWWSPGPGPELARISTGRAYAEVVLVFAAFFLTGVVAGSLLLAGSYRNLLAGGGWADYGTQAVDLVSQVGLAVAVVLLVGARRGVGRAELGLVVPRLDDGRLAVSRTVRIVAWALLALVAGGVVNASLQTGHLPTGPPTDPELLFGVVDSLQAGIIEELVVLAFVVVTLRQARRPLWEIAVVALVLRGSYHVYYGPGVVGIVLWAALYYWIYLRTRQLLPLMACHAAWDAAAFLSQRWHAVAAVAVLLVAGIWIVAPLLWLVERNDRPGVSQVRTRAPGPGPPPGWHPDPAGYDRWRWWDGRRWTEHVSSHDVRSRG